jgi:prepilin-type N-terminal cleavage/methylation domain-containing protein
MKARLWAAARARRGDDRGVTLVETLVVIVVMGVITVPIAASIIIALKTTGSSTTRFSESHDRQQVEVYLSRDVASSSSPPSFNTTGTCVTTSPSVVVLKWTGTQLDNSVPATTLLQSYEADYVFDATARRLTRHLCQGGGAASLVTVASSLSSSVAPTASASGKSVTMVLTDSSGLAYSVTAKGRT